MRIVDVVPIDNYILFVETENGSTGVFDLKPYLGGEVFAPLQDHAEFSAVHNGGYFIEWPCGADLSADTIAAHLKAVPSDIAQQLKKADPKTARRVPRNAPSP
jgi:hypothetical protein